jgi:hypothetical protein
MQDYKFVLQYHAFNATWYLTGYVNVESANGKRVWSVDGVTLHFNTIEDALKSIKDSMPETAYASGDHRY